MTKMRVVLTGQSDSQDDLIKVESNLIKLIDTRGMACPYPSFESVKAMSLLSSDKCIDILTDSDESALKSIPNVCRRRNWKFIVFEDGERVWRVRIAK